MKIRWLLSVLACAFTSSAGAMPLSYTVDPARSVLILSGGNGLETWSWGSTEDPIVHDGFTTSYAGTMLANRDAAAGTFQITDSNVVAQNFPGIAFGPPGDSPAPCNYVFLSPLASGLSSSTLQGAIREFSLSLRGPPGPDSTSFDSSQLTGTITSGRLDWAFAFSSLGNDREIDGTSPITGDLVLAPGRSTLVEIDGVETLSIPLATDFFIMVDSSPMLVHLSGTIVATQAVPEAAGIMLIAPLALLLPRHRRRCRYNRGQP